MFMNANNGGGMSTPRGFGPPGTQFTPSVVLPGSQAQGQAQALAQAMSQGHLPASGVPVVSEGLGGGAPSQTLQTALLIHRLQNQLGGGGPGGHTGLPGAGSPIMRVPADVAHGFRLGGPVGLPVNGPGNAVYHTQMI